MSKLSLSKFLSNFGILIRRIIFCNDFRILFSKSWSPMGFISFCVRYFRNLNIATHHITATPIIRGFKRCFVPYITTPQLSTHHWMMMNTQNLSCGWRTFGKAECKKDFYHIIQSFQQFLLICCPSYLYIECCLKWEGTSDRLSFLFLYLLSGLYSRQLLKQTNHYRCHFLLSLDLDLYFW